MIIEEYAAKSGFRPVIEQYVPFLLAQAGHDGGSL
jgi:hypothetical protein